LEFKNVIFFIETIVYSRDLGKIILA